MDANGLLREMVVSVRTDLAGLDRGLAQATQKSQQASRSIAAAFFLAQGFAQDLQAAIQKVSFAHWVRDALETAGSIKDLSRQLDFAASSLLNLNGLLIENGSSLQQFAGSVNILNANLGAAASGSRDMIDNFDRLGLSVSELKRIGPEQAFYAIVQALARLKDQSEQTELGRALLGRGFASMIPLIKATNGELGQAIDQMNRLNGDTLNESIRHLDEVGDRFDALGNKLKNDFLVGLSLTIKGFERLNELIASTPSSAGAYASGKLGQFTPTPEIPVPAGIPPEKADAYRQWYMKSRQRGAVTSFEFSKQNPAAGTNKKIKEATTEFVRAQKDVQTAVKDTAEAFDDASERGKVFAVILKDHIGDAFESALFDAKNFSGALTTILEGVARQIARIGFIDPLSGAIGQSISNSFKGSSLLSNLANFLPSFDVGTSYVPHDMIARIHQGERIVPANQNARTGNIVINQVFQMQPGLAETVGAAVRSAAPSIAAAAHASVFQAIQGGGPEARIVGVRG